MSGTLPFEQVYLQMMKWILGVNKKTANAAIYEDTGRYPLSIVCSKQLINYIQRVAATKNNSDIYSKRRRNWTEDLGARLVHKNWISY